VLPPLRSIRLLETTGDKIHALLAYHAAYIGNFLPTFRGKLSLPSSRAKKSKEKILFDLLTHDDETDWFSRTVGEKLPVYTA
jgi:hypothetical protein